MTAPGKRPRAWLCALPAMILVMVALLPFLNSAFTIDDPLYLTEAQHTLEDPLHPQAFRVVWSLDQDFRASRILPGGLAVPYLLLPTVMAGSPEWAGHLTQLIELLFALYGMALLALRLGLDEWTAGAAVLLVATAPAVLGMAGTVMPDIAAMLFVILGMERLVVWREHRKWRQAVLATLWLSLAGLTRTQTMLVLPAAFVLVLDGIGGPELRSSFREFRLRFVPVLLVPVAFAAVSALLSDPDRQGNTILSAVFSAVPQAIRLISQNSISYLAHWVMVVPLTIPWFVLRFRKLSSSRLLMVAIALALVGSHWRGWPVFAAMATVVVLVDIAWDAIGRRDRVQLALWFWLLLPIPAVIYVHLPAKYLLPCAPAVALLIGLRLAGANLLVRRWLVPSLTLCGTLLGVLILLAGRNLAEGQRLAADELVAAHVQAGERVWFAGHWGFQWYAEKAGARPVTLFPPLPLKGDIIVVSFIDLPLFVQHWSGARTVLTRVSYDQPGGRVMDLARGAGFYSNGFGNLPWIWSKDETNWFEVWRVE